MRIRPAVVAAVLLGGPTAVTCGQAPAPPSNVTAADHATPDNGTRIDVHWELSPDDDTLVAAYEIMSSIGQIGDLAVTPVFKIADVVPAGTSVATVVELTRELDRLQVESDYADRVDVPAAVDTGDDHFRLGYVFQVVAVGRDGSRSAPARTAEPVRPETQWFDGYRLWFVITIVVFCGSVVLFINLARRGKPLKVRKIAGLEAVDEAVGRATEMGRSVLFIPGILDMNDIQTIAGINILARVSKTAATYEAGIEVPTSRSLVMTAARETVHNSFLEAGRPDAYNDDLIYYVTDEQFGYVAYVQGMMVREKPAACFYMGAFFAESLILAETGNSIGAIQVAGTAMPAQLPFFVAACDYTLIGEEFFAASAYLTGTPEELGSLKGQDVGKVIVAGGIVGGVVVLSLATIILNGSPDSPFGLFLQTAVNFFKDTMLT
ncbi:MAG: DUF6754 domain-containing protein [Planctomycetota bacterium]|jgi:hypothetical protein